LTGAAVSRCVWAPRPPWSVSGISARARGAGDSADIRAQAGAAGAAARALRAGARWDTGHSTHGGRGTGTHTRCARGPLAERVRARNAHATCLDRPNTGSQGLHAVRVHANDVRLRRIPSHPRQTAHTALLTPEHSTYAMPQQLETETLDSIVGTLRPPLPPKTTRPSPSRVPRTPPRPAAGTHGSFVLIRPCARPPGCISTGPRHHRPSAASMIDRGGGLARPSVWRRGRDAPAPWPQHPPARGRCRPSLLRGPPSGVAFRCNAGAAMPARRPAAPAAAKPGAACRCEAGRCLPLLSRRRRVGLRDVHGHLGR